MKIPKEMNDYCSRCNTHTVHKLKQFKPGHVRALAWGNRENIRKHKKGYGGKSEFTAVVKKQTKKPTFLSECKVCGRKHYFVIPKRMKKPDLVSAT